MNPPQVYMCSPSWGEVKWEACIINITLKHSSKYLDALAQALLLSRTQLSDFTFTFHFHALEKEMATYSSVLAWRIPGMAEPGGLPSMGSHRVGHDWSDLAAAAAPLEGLVLIESVGFWWSRSPVFCYFLSPAEAGEGALSKMAAPLFLLQGPLGLSLWDIDWASSFQETEWDPVCPPKFCVSMGPSYPFLSIPFSPDAQVILPT